MWISSKFSVRSVHYHPTNKFATTKVCFTDRSQIQPTLNSFAALDQPIRAAVRAQIRKDLETGAVPDLCLEKLADVKQHLPMQMQGFSDFYTSLEHCQNCSGEMAAAKIPKNWFYVRVFLFPILNEQPQTYQLILDLPRRRQSTTRACPQSCLLQAPYPDLPTSTSPTASTQSPPTVPPGGWTSSSRWATSSPSPYHGASACRSRMRNSTSLVSYC